ncbi:hypothetical protein M408DRAFT_333180 [Serendipita vermifera MAFF 305830]|uniref:Uncharacterized protein n=1 Tax=Serendipita vermifera MAFF 305830 TaxID=933852 RepID=A0A0C2W640_SERVB|nr:hypothetical protein M408DRAFT_333180 [Serendipita vermifera MAFF 305830]
MNFLSPNSQEGHDHGAKPDLFVVSPDHGPNTQQAKGSSSSIRKKETRGPHSVAINNSPGPSGFFTSVHLLHNKASLGSNTGSSAEVGMPNLNSVLSGEFSTLWFYLFSFLLNVQGVAAKIDFVTLIQETRRLSMSGILGLLDTDILFAESGTSQPEHWRVIQGTLGIGALRVLSRISKMPCFEALHQIHGIKPPESVEAREFWLRQEAWTELQGLDMGQEDTSYHRINQGSGPQGKLLWNWEEIETEKNRWEAQKKNGLGEGVQTSAIQSQGSNAKRSRDWGGATTSIPVGVRKGEEISQGTTDKWWMDRWQIEAIAVASEQNLTLEDACSLLTTAYFGKAAGHLPQIISGALCVLSTTTTVVAAWYTNWGWVSQFFALSSLGYFVNWTASIRGWKFVPAPSPAVRSFRPRILKFWPTRDEIADNSAIRIAVQSSGTAHLKGLILLPKYVLDEAKDMAATRRGRYKINRKFNSNDTAPYADTKRRDWNWISFESQSSYYGLLVSVEPDNVTCRSLGVIWAMVNGLCLLILGFGSSIPDDWSGYILLIYVCAIALAIFGRCRGCVWTLPEFTKVDFTVENAIVPPTMRPRVIGLELEHPLKIAEGPSQHSPFPTAQHKRGVEKLV